MTPTFKSTLKKLIREVMEQDKAVAKNVRATDSFDDFLEKPDNKSNVLFTQKEIDTANNSEIKPTKADGGEITFGSVEATSGKNKTLVVRKKTNRYVGFFCLKNPDDIGSPDDASEEKPKDEIFIKISRPISNGVEDVSLLSNFINEITREYQI